MGFYNIIKIASDFKIKHFIFGSSSSVYGEQKKFPIKDLDHPLKYKWNKTFDYNWNTKSDQKNWVLPKVLKDQASLIPNKDFLQFSFLSTRIFSNF